MTREDIIRMAREAKLPYEYDTGRVLHLKELERFAELVAAAEPVAWQGVTEPELHEINPTWPAPGENWTYEDVLAFVRAIEAKLKEKNT